MIWERLGERTRKGMIDEMPILALILSGNPSTLSYVRNNKLREEKTSISVKKNLLRSLQLWMAPILESVSDKSEACFFCNGVRCSFFLPAKSLIRWPTAVGAGDEQGVPSLLGCHVAVDREVAWAVLRLDHIEAVLIRDTCSDAVKLDFVAWTPAWEN